MSVAGTAAVVNVAGTAAVGMTAAAGMTTAVGMTAAAGTTAASREPLASSLLVLPDLASHWILPCSLGWCKSYQLLQIPWSGNELASWNQERSPTIFLGGGGGGVGRNISMPQHKW